MSVLVLGENVLMTYFFQTQERSKQMTEVDHGPVMFIAGRRYPEHALYPVHVPYIQYHASNVNEGCLHQSRGRSYYVLRKTNISYGPMKSNICCFARCVISLI